MNTNNTVTGRIKESLVAQNLLAKDLSDLTGIPQPTLSVLLRQTGDNMKSTQLFAIAKALKVSPVWLMTGEHEQPVVAVSDDQQLPDDYVRVPTYSVKAAAGAGSEPTWEEIHTVRPATFHRSFFTNRGLNPARCFRLPIEGDSMEPQIRSGDYVTFERVPESFTWRNVKDGAIYALADSDGTRVKRLGKMYDGLIIHSDNPAYPDEIFKGEDLNRIKIIGLAIERSGGIS